MKKKNKKIIGISAVSGAAATAAIVGTSIHFANKNNKIDKNDDRLISFDSNNETDPNKIKENELNNIGQLKQPNVYLDHSNVLIKPDEKIRYLALGDSITAGFNAQLGVDLAGDYNQETKEISGLSWPSFFAQYVNTLENDRLESYTNLGITSSKTQDWLYLLEDVDQSYFDQKGYEFFEFVKTFENQKDSVYKKRLVNVFENFGRNQDQKLITSAKEVNTRQFSKFKELIKQANVISLTIGANDFLQKIDYTTIFNLLKDENNQTVEAFNEILNKIKIQASKVSQNIKKIVNAVKRLNKNVSINLVGYPMPFLRLMGIIQSKVIFKNINIFEEILNIVNQASRDAANPKENINYIETYDRDDWFKYNDKFAKVPFDIHPTEIGYKKMAQEVFLKLTLGQDYNKDKKYEIANKIYNNWDQEYFNKDKDLFKQQIAYADKTNNTIANTILGNSEGILLFSKSKLEQDKTLNELIKKQTFNLTPLIESWIQVNKNQFNFFEKQFLGILKLLGIDDDFIDNFLKTKDKNNESNLYKISLAIINSGYINSLFKGIQKDFDSFDLDKNNIIGTQNINTNIFQTVFLKNAFDDNNLFVLVKTLLQSKVFETNQQEVKLIVKKIINQIINPKNIIELIFGNDQKKSSQPKPAGVENKDEIVLINRINETKSLEKIINMMVDTIFDHPQQYENLNSISNVFAKVVNINKNTFDTLVTSFINSLIENEESQNAVYNLIKKSLNKNIPSFIISQENESLMKKILAQGTNIGLINDFKNNLIESFAKPQTYLSIFSYFGDSANKENIYNSMFTLINPTSKSFIKNIIELMLLDDIEVNEWSAFVSSMLNTQTITNIFENGLFNIVEIFNSNPTIEKIKKLDFSEFINNFFKAINEKQLGDLQKAKIKEIFNLGLKEVFDNKNTNIIINALIDFANNKVGDLLLGIQNPLVKQNVKTIYQLFTKVLNKVIFQKSTQELALSVLNDFIDNSQNYINVSSWKDIIVTILNSNQQLQFKFDNWIKDILNDLEISDLMSELLVGIINEFIPLNNKIQGEDALKIKNLLQKIIIKIPDLELYKDIRQKAFDLLKNNIVALLNQNPSTISNLKQEAINSLLKINFSSIVEIIEIDELKEIDFIEVFDIFLNNLDYDTISNLIKQDSYASENGKNNQLKNDSLEVFDIKEFALNLVKKLANSKTLYINEHDDPINHLKIQTYRTKLKTIATTIISKTLNHSGVKQIVSAQLQQLFNTTSVFSNALINEQQKQSIANSIVDVLINNDLLTNAINSIITNFIDNANNYASINNFADLVVLLIKDNEQQLKTTIKNLLVESLTNSDIQELIVKLILKTINYEFQESQIKIESLDKFKTFIGNFVSGLVETKLYNNVINLIFENLKNVNQVQKLLSNNTEDIQKVILESLSLNEPKKVIQWFELIEIPNITARDYADVIEIILFEVGIKIKTQNNQNDVNPTNNNNVASNELQWNNSQGIIFRTIKEILTNGIKDSQKQKIKDIIQFISDDFVNINSNSIIRQELSKISTSFANLIISFLPKTSLIKDEYERLINQIIQNNDFLTKSKDLILIIINELIDNNNQYQNVNSFGELIAQLFKNSETNIKNKLKEVINTIFKNESIVASFSNTLIKTFKLESNNPQLLDNYDETKINSFVKKILSRITDLSLYNKTLDKFFEFFKNQAQPIFEEENFSFNNFKTKFIEAVSPSISDYFSLLELFAFEEIHEDEWKEVIGFIVDYFPLSQIFKSLTNKNDSFNLNTATNINDEIKDDKTNKNTLDFIFEILHALVSSNTLNNQDNNEKILINATKIYNVVIFAIERILSSNNTKSFATEIISSNQFIINQLNKLNLEQSKHQEFVSIIVNAITEDKNLINIIKTILKPIIFEANEFANVDSLSAMINLMTSKTKDEIKKHLFKLIADLLKKDVIQEVLLRAIIPLINHNANYDSIDDVVINNMKNFITKIADNLESIDFLSDIFDNISVVLGNVDKTNNLLNGDFSNLIEVFKDVLNFNEPNKIVKVIDLFNIESITAQDYFAFIKNIVFDIKINVEKTNDNSNNGLDTINNKPILESIQPWFKYVKALLNYDIQPTTKVKIKEIIRLFLDYLLQQDNSQQLWNDLIDVIKQKAIKPLIDKVNVLAPLQDKYDEIINLILNNVSLKNELKELIIKFTTNIIDNTSIYAQANDFGELINLVLANNKALIKNSITKVIANIIGNSKISFKLANNLFETYLVYFDIKSMSQSEKDNIVLIIQKAINHLPQLTYLNQAIEQGVDFIANNLVYALNQNSSNFNENLNQFLENNIIGPNALASLFEIFANPQINSFEWITLTKTLIQHFPIQKIVELIQQTANSREINAPANELNNEINHQTNVQKIESIFNFVKKVMNSKWINGQAEESNLEQVTLTKDNLKIIFDTLIHSVFANNNIKDFVKAQLRTLVLNLDLNKIGITISRIEILINDSIDLLFTNGNLINLLSNISDSLFTNWEYYASSQSMLDLFARIIRLNKTEIKTNITSIIKKLLNQDDLINFAFEKMLNTIKPGFDFKTLSAQKQKTLKDFAKKLINNVDQIDLYNKIFDSFINNLSSTQKFANIINDLQNELINIIKSQIDINDPTSVIKLIDILEIEAITADDYTNLIKTIVFDVVLTKNNLSSQPINEDEVSSPLNTSDSNKIFSIIVEYLKAFANYDLKPNSLNKLKLIIQNLVHFVLNDQQAKDVLNEQIDEWAQVIANLITTKVIKLQPLNNNYQQAIKTIVNNQNLRNNLKELILTITNSVLDNKQNFNNVTSIADVVQLFVDSNIELFKQKTKNLVDTLFNDSQINSIIIENLVSSYQTYFDLNIPTQDLQRFKNALGQVFINVTNLDYYNNIFNQTFGFIKDNIRAIVENNTISNEMLNELSTSLSPNIDNVLSFLQIFSFENINNNQWIDLVEVFVKYLPIQKIIELFNNQNNKTVANDQLDNNKQSQQNWQQLVFDVLQKLLKLKYFNKNTPQSEFNVNNTINRINTTINTLITNLFRNQEAKQIVIDKLSNLIIQTTNNIDFITNETKQQLTSSMINKLFNEPYLSNILSNLLTNTINNTNLFININSLEELIAKAISVNEGQIKNDFKLLIKTVLNDQILFDVINQFVFKQVNSNKNYSQITLNNKNNLKLLITKVLQNIDHFSLFNETINNLFSTFKQPNNINILLNNNQNQMLDLIKQIFDFTNPQTIARLITILDNQYVTDNDYINGIMAVLNEFDFSLLFATTNKINSTNNATTNPNNVQSNINDAYKYVKALLNYDTISSQKTRIKNIVNTIIANLVSTHSQGVINNLANKLADFTTNLLVTNVQELVPITNEFKQFIIDTVKNPTLLNGFSSLVRTIIDEFVNNHKVYGSANTFGELVQNIFNKNKINILNGIKNTYKSVFSLNSKPLNQFIYLFRNALKAFFNIEFTRTEETQIYNLPNLVMSRFFDFKFVNDSFDRLFSIIVNNVDDLIDQKADFAEILKTEFVNEIIKPEQIIHVFEFVEYDNNNAIINFFKVMIDKIPTRFYKKYFDPLFNQLNKPSNRSTNEENKALSWIEWIEILINAPHLKNQDTYFKLKNIAKELVKYILHSPNLTDYVREKIKDLLEPKLTQATGIDVQSTRLFIHRSFEFIINHSTINDLISQSVDHLMDNRFDYVKKAKISLTDVFNHLIENKFEGFKQPLINLVTEFIKSDSTTDFIAKFIFAKLKLQATNENDVIVVRNFIRGVVNHYKEIDFLNSFIERLLWRFKHFKLDLFSQEGVQKILELVEALGMTNPINFTKLVNIIDDNKLSAKTIAEFINLVFEKSPLSNYDDLNSYSHPLFYGLKNLKEESLSGVIFGSLGNSGQSDNKAILNEPTQNISGVDPLANITTLMSKLWDGEREVERRSPTKYYHQNPITRALTHLGIVMTWYVHETYFRNVISGVWWTGIPQLSGEGKVFFALKADHGRYSENIIWRVIMGNRHPWLWNMPRYSSYSKNDFLFMITYWKQHPYSRHTSGKKMVDEIFEAIKRGYGEPYKRS